MDDITIKHLLSRRFEYSSNRDTEFSHRIKSDHWFNSIDDCVSYLYSIVHDNPYTHGSIGFNSYKQAPVFGINIIDEGICSMIYEIFQFRYKKDNDELNRSETLLKNLVDDINHQYDKLKEQNHLSNNFFVISALRDIVMSVHDICIPIEEYHEEAIFELLSEQYYHLMYYAYSDIYSEDMYYCNKMKRRYSEYL